jgi:hypothetical protein
LLLIRTERGMITWRNPRERVRDLRRIICHVGVS